MILAVSNQGPIPPNPLEENASSSDSFTIPTHRQSTPENISRLMHKLMAAEDEDFDILQRALYELPTAELLPELLTAWDKGGTPEQRRQMVRLFADIGWNSQEAADRVAGEVLRANQEGWLLHLAGCMRSFGDLVVDPILAAFKTHGSKHDERVAFLDLLSALRPTPECADKIIAQVLPLAENGECTHPPEVSFAALKTLISICPAHPQNVKILMGRISDRCDPYRLRYLGLCLLLGGNCKSLLPEIIEMLDSPVVGPTAVRLCGKLGRDAAPALPKLLSILADPEEDSASILETLLRLPHQRSAAVLAEALDDDSRRWLVCQKLRVVRSAGWSPEEISPLIQKIGAMLGGDHKLEMLDAVCQLRDLALPLVDDVLSLLAHRDQGIQLAAITAVGTLQVGGKQLHNLALSDHKALRVAALAALGGPCPADAVPTLLAAAKDTDIALSKAAFQGLRGYGDLAPPEFINLAIERLNSDDEGLRWSAALAIVELGPVAAAAVPAILPLLTDTASGLEEPAFESLYAMGPAAIAALPEVEKLIGDPRLGPSARLAVWRISPERAGELGLPPIR